MSVPHSEPEEQRPAAGDDDRPDWLVGADEGVMGELARTRESRPTPEVRLVRPTGPEPDGAPAAPRRLPPAEPGAADFGALDFSGPEPGGAQAGSLRLADAKRAPEPAPEKPEAWKAAASSVPTLPREPARVVPFPAAARAVPADDADEAEFDDPAAPLDFPDDGPELAVVPPPASRAARAREAWWLVALDELRSNTRLQVALAALGIVSVAALLLWPREAPGVSIREVRAHPERWDGRAVTLKGRVGDVFPVGAGYAFHLVQGRDTMVVFTRSRAPQRRSSLAVTGKIQTGYLDGLPRQSLFESP